MYFYVMEEYRVSNQLLTEDIYVRAIPPSAYACTTNFVPLPSIPQFLLLRQFQPLKQHNN